MLWVLRKTLGAQAAPPNQVLIGLSLFLTLFVMPLTLEKSRSRPGSRARRTRWPTAKPEVGLVPIQEFMLEQTREGEIELFAQLAVKEHQVEDRADVPMTTLIPAYVPSELKTAFLIGFVVFMPFLIIDMVVASGLMSMGMFMLSPSSCCRSS